MENWEAVYLPEERLIENQTGKFHLIKEAKDDRVVVTRELSFPRVDFSGDDWKELRELLLAEKHDRNRTVLLKKST